MTNEKYAKRAKQTIARNWARVYNDREVGVVGNCLRGENKKCDRHRSRFL
ncbi:MAG: hypothetical protein K2G31_00560 [Clostridia bacterium]|nr:hypothetical protein [Clostridia bacterium]